MFARFANSIIEPILNRNYVQSVQYRPPSADTHADAVLGIATTP